MADAKADLHRYLRHGREAVLWKLDGLSEYDARRPRTPTATNVLGVIQHLACVEAGYFGLVFDRPFTEPLPIDDVEDDPHADLWVPAEVPRAEVVGLYRRVQAHADATIDALEVHAPGRVPHWPDDRAAITLHGVLVHMIAETHRHAGQLDVLREGLDGAVGHRPGSDNMAEGSAAVWAVHRARVEDAARRASGT